MNIVPIQYSYFDDKAIRAMGAAFDQACHSFRNFAHFDRVRELVAKRIIEAAKNGERDPTRLHWQAVMRFSFDDVSIPVDGVRRNLPVPVYAPIARLAQLAQNRCRFLDSTTIGVSRIKGLCRAQSQIGGVVPTLGIDVRQGSMILVGEGRFAPEKPRRRAILTKFVVPTFRLTH